MSESPIAIFCSDIHLSEKPPAARSAEPDWFEAMARPLRELGSFANKLSLPILCAGDIFHKWNPSPRLINFAIAELPFMRAIPGQHDLRYHSLEDIRSSAFWTLVESGRIAYLNPKQTPWNLQRDWLVHSVPWGCLPPPPSGKKNIALVHMFVCSKDTAYPGAPEEAFYPRARRLFKGYDLAVFGDNHKPFEAFSKKSCSIYNNGAFLRRTQPERDHKPSVGLFYEDGSIKRHYLDCSEDKFSEPAEAPLPEAAVSEEMEQFFEELAGLSGESLDFSAAVRRWAERPDVSPAVKGLLLEAIGGG